MTWKNDLWIPLSKRQDCIPFVTDWPLYVLLHVGCDWSYRAGIKMCSCIRSQIHLSIPLMPTHSFYASTKFANFWWGVGIFLNHIHENNYRPVSNAGVYLSWLKGFGAGQELHMCHYRPRFEPLGPLNWQWLTKYLPLCYAWSPLRTAPIYVQPQRAIKTGKLITLMHQEHIY